MVMMIVIFTVQNFARFSLRIDRHAHDLSVTYAALSDDMLAELLHVVSLTLEHRDLEAGVMIEMDVQRSERQLVVLMIGVRQALGELPGGMVVGVDEAATHSRF